MSTNLEAYIDHDDLAEDDDRPAWSLTLPNPSGVPFCRRSWSPEPLVHAALKWARDRGVRVTVIVYGEGVTPPTEGDTPT